VGNYGVSSILIPNEVVNFYIVYKVNMTRSGGKKQSCRLLFALHSVKQGSGPRKTYLCFIGHESGELNTVEHC